MRDVVVDEPVRGTYGDSRALAMPGLEAALAYARGQLPAVPLHHLTGMRPVEASLGRSTFAMPITGWLTDNAGIIEPGVLAFLADAPLASAIYTGLGPGIFVSTSELSLTFIQPVHSDASGLTARARVVHANRQVGVSTAEVEDSQGRLLAYASTRCVINPASRVPADQPPPADPDTPDPHLRPARGTVYPPELWDGMTGLEFCRRVADGSLDHGPVGYLFGVEMVAASEGSTTWQLPTSRWLCAAGPAIYGGVIGVLAQMTQDLSIMTTLPAGTAFATLDLKLHFLRPVLPDTGRLTAIGDVIHRGRSIAVAHVRITNEQGKTVAISSGSAMIVPDGIRRLKRGEIPSPT